MTTFKRLDNWRDKWLLIYDDNIIYLFIFLSICFIYKNCKFFILFNAISDAYIMFKYAIFLYKYRKIIISVNLFLGVY